MRRWAQQQATGRAAADAGHRGDDPVAWKVSDVGKNAGPGGLRGCQGAPGAGPVVQGLLLRSTALPSHGPVTKNPPRTAVLTLPARVVQRGCAPPRPPCLADSGDSATRQCP